MFCKKCGNSLLPGAVFCGVCGTRVEAGDLAAAVEQPVQQAVEAVEAAPQQVAEAVEAVPQQAEAYVEQQAQQFEQPVEQVAAAVEAAPQQVAEAVEAAPQKFEQPVQQAAETVAAAAFVEQPVQQPVYQQPQQPVQQPVYQQPQQPVQQPVYQQPQQPVQQPVYQQPQQPTYQQPVYAQPVYQQPVPEKKKKSKAPVIIISILLILIILAGSGVAYLTFLDKNGAKNYFGIDWNFADFTQLSKKEEETFLELAGSVNKAITDGSSRQFKKAINADAIDYVCKSFGCTDMNDFLAFCAEDLEECGNNVTASEKAYLKYQIKDTKSLESKLKKQCDAEFDISKAYLVECVTTYKGSEKSKSVKDPYLMIKDGDDNWSLILLGKESLKDLGLD